MILESTNWLPGVNTVVAPHTKLPLAERFTAFYGDTDKAKPTNLVVRLGTAILDPDFRYFEAELVMDFTGEVVLIDRIE